MAFLKYYEDERARQPNARACLCTAEEAERAIRKMARHFKVPCPRIEFTSGSRGSHYRPTFDGGIIRLNRGSWERAWIKGPDGEPVRTPEGRMKIERTWKPYLNWLLVAHEFAHAWDRVRRGRDYRHDRKHARLTDRAVAYIYEKNWPLGRLKAQEPQVQERVAACPAPDNRIQKRQEQVARLSRKIKALTTRKRKAERSLAALLRAQARKEGA